MIMKRTVLSKVTAFVTALAVTAGFSTAFPQGQNIVVSADVGDLTAVDTVTEEVSDALATANSYSSFSNVPCGEYSVMSLENGLLTISGNGDMFDLHSYSGDYIYDYYTYEDYIMACRSYITSVKISDGITSIGDWALSGSQISSVVIPDTVTRIGDDAFYLCESLTSVTISESVEHIGAYAFAHTGLKGITIPKTVTEFGYGAFENIPGQLTLYCYSNSAAHEYAEEYSDYDGFTYVLLDKNLDISDEKDLVECIEDEYGHKVTDYICIDMNHDGLKEIIAVILNDSMKYDIVYCGSNGYFKITGKVDTVDYGDYFSFDSIDFSEESHVIINYGNNYGDWQYSKILALHYNAISILFDKRGQVTVNDDNTITLTTYQSAPATTVETVYYYDETEMKYKESKSESSENDPDITADSRYDYLYLAFEPENLTYVYNADLEEFITKSTECEFSLSCVDLLMDGHFMDINKIVVTPPKGFTINTLDVFDEYTITYVVPVSLSSSNKTDCEEHFTLNVPTKEFLEGNPLTESYNTMLTVTVYGDNGFVKTFEQDINVKYDDTSIADSDNTETMISFINEHYWSQVPRYWNKYHEVQNTKEDYDDNIYTESGHMAAIVLDSAEKVFTVDIDGVVQKISANAYNSILLDMFINVSGNESFLTQAMESSDKAIRDCMGPVASLLSQASKTGTNYNTLKYSETLGDGMKDILKVAKDGDENTVAAMLSLFGISDDISVDTLKELSCDDDLFGEIGDVSKGINNAFEFFENLQYILEAQTLLYMDEEYEGLLNEIYEAADNYNGNSWEITDLKYALRYEIEYRKNYDLNLTWESIKNANSITGFSGEVIDAIWDDYIKSFIIDVWGEAFFLKFSAAQIAVTMGSYFSDQMFNINESTDLYYEGKSYGILEEILRGILDEKASKLELYIEGEEYSSADIERMYSNAKIFDYAFKMYAFTEEKGCTTYSNYEKMFLIDDSNWYDRFWDVLGESLEIIIRMHMGDFDAFWDMQKIHMIRNYNALWYQRRADFIKENIKCHGEEFADKDSALEYVKKVSDNYLKMLETDMKYAEVMCPVEVEVYDENGKYIGTISDEQNTIENNLNIYAYKNEYANSNVIVCPANYTIKLKGLDDGKMTVLSGYYSESAIENAVAYIGIPVTDKYVAELDITADNNSLIDSSTTQPDNPNNTPTTPENPGYPGGGSYDFGIIQPTVSILKIYTVTFQGCTVIEVESGKTIKKLPVPDEKSGYIFDGWYIDEEFTEEFTSDTVVTANIVVYPKWTKGEDMSAGAGIEETNNGVNINDCIFTAVIAMAAVSVIMIIRRKRQK